jgi:hypothetical protein
MLKSSKKHLKETNESYFQHMKIASKIFLQMFLGSLMALVHSIVPAFFKTDASQRIKDLYIFIEGRKK